MRRQRECLPLPRPSSFSCFSSTSSRGKSQADWVWKFNHQSRAGNETAFEHYSRAVDRDPTSAEAHAGLATVFVFRSHYLPDRDRWSAAAVESANRALSLDVRNAAAARAAGMAYLEVGKFAEAEAHFRRALDLRPDDHNTPLNLGWVLTMTGKRRSGRRAPSPARGRDA